MAIRAILNAGAIGLGLLGAPSLIEGGINLTDHVSGRKRDRVRKLMRAQGQSSALAGIDLAEDASRMKGESELISYLEQMGKPRARLGADHAERMFLEGLMMENQEKLGMIAARVQQRSAEASFIDNLKMQHQELWG